MQFCNMYIFAVIDNIQCARKMLEKKIQCSQSRGVIVRLYRILCCTNGALLDYTSFILQKGLIWVRIQ